MRPLAQIRLYMHRASNTLPSSSVVMYSPVWLRLKSWYPLAEPESRAFPRHGVASPARRVLQVGEARVRLHDVVREVDQQLGEAALSCRVVAQNGGEGGVAEGFGEALAEGFAGAGVVTQPVYLSVHIS